MPASCPPTPAAIINRAEAVMPDIARAAHMEGTAITKIEIDANGKVTKASIQKSSGAGPLDQAAMKTARETTYKPATEGCKAVSSVYVMVVDFSDQ